MQEDSEEEEEEEEEDEDTDSEEESEEEQPQTKKSKMAAALGQRGKAVEKLLPPKRSKTAEVRQPLLSEIPGVSSEPSAHVPVPDLLPQFLVLVHGHIVLHPWS